ncbi:MAG: hypothetical protein V1672_01110 [Candidatus Diapherotrites archaeon]
MSDNLLKNWQVMILIAALVLSFAVLAINGLKFGIDFEGGTIFYIHLAESVEDADEMSQIVTTISQRLDWTGLKDTKVVPWGKDFLVVQIAETDPDTVERMEALLKKQGRFEVTINGDLIFTGDEIIKITKDPAQGYGFRKEGDTYQWLLPFTLKSTAAQSFTEKTFHKCTISAYDPQYGSQYDCDRTYFFIDRPVNSILIIPREIYESDKLSFIAGNQNENIPQNTKVDEVLVNSALTYFIVDDALSEEQITELETHVSSNEEMTALIHVDISSADKQKLSDIGYVLKESTNSGNTPWIWDVTNTRQVISLSEDVTNMNVAKIEDAELFSDLVIRGFASDAEQAQSRLSDLTILLESGSLSTPVDSISKETISPLLGERFLFNAGVMGLIALILVAIVIYIRYRIFNLMIPIILTGLSEVIIILGFASLIKWNLDLAAVAGILAVVGTGVDHQIVITDELMKGEGDAEASFITRIKRAFFIIVAAASTTIVTMLPIVLFGFGFGKLVGFAITTIVGVLVGVFITRPAFGELAKKVLR